MVSKDILSLWKKISGIIAEEISNNDDFAQKIGNVIGDDAPPVTTKKRNRRLPAKIDPFHLLEQGEDALSVALAELSIDELKDVISANGMDTSKLAMKWKDRERLEKHIIDATKRKSSRGEAFWNSSGKAIINDGE
jgi:hypothetical protein